MAPMIFVTGGSGFVGGALVRRLVAEGAVVRALARSERAAQAVSALGAEPVPGDLGDAEAIASGAGDCQHAYHVAAFVGPGGRWEDYELANVVGTRNVLEGCRRAGVKRLVLCGTEAALMAGKPLHNVDEQAPLRPDSPAPYPATKARAEIVVRDAARDGFETVVVRPRLVWGPGDTSVLPAIVDMVRAGRFAWIGGGRQHTATTHVDNAVEGLILGAMRGRSGEAYFVTDGEPVVFREFITALLRTQGVEAPDRSIPAPVAAVAARLAELAWRALPRRGDPPVDRFAIWAAGHECTIDITKARTELGYAPIVSREEGLAGLGALGIGMAQRDPPG